MKFIFSLTIIISVFILSSCGSSNVSSGSNRAFSEFEKYADENEWFFNREEMTRKFNAARIALGDEFAEELFIMAGNDMERIYWCGLYLITDDYLHSSDALPELASELFDKGLSIKTDPASHDDEEINKVENQTSIKVFATILSYQIGKTDKAKKLKKELEDLFERFPYYKSSFPAMTDEQRGIYDDI